MNTDLQNIINRVHNCTRCGKEFAGYQACGFGKTDHPLVFFIGMNPWVGPDHKFVDGKGITELKRRLAEWKFDDFYFDNVVKCQIPHILFRVEPRYDEADNCHDFLRKQIQIIQPKHIIIFGSFAQTVMWQHQPENRYRYTSFPHFSSVYYSSPMAMENFYIGLRNKLRGIGGKV